MKSEPHLSHPVHQRERESERVRDGQTETEMFGGTGNTNFHGSSPHLQRHSLLTPRIH